MAHLFRFGNSAFDLDAVVAVDNDRVVFRDGHSERFSKAGIAALLEALPEWHGGAAARGRNDEGDGPTKGERRGKV